MEVGVWDGNTGLTVSLTQFLLSKTLTYFPIFLLSKWYIEFLPNLTQCANIRGLPTESRHKDGQRGGLRHHGSPGEAVGREGTSQEGTSCMLCATWSDIQASLILVHRRAQNYLFSLITIMLHK